MGVDEGFIRTIILEVEEKWPLAYAEPFKGVFVDLADHLFKTADLIQLLFKERLECINAEFQNLISRGCGRGLEITVYDVAYLAGLLHDLGKASSFYLNEFKNKLLKEPLNIQSKDLSKLKLSFRFHEYVAPALLINAAHSEVRENVCEGELMVYYILSRIIARHHVAIKDRHPMEFLNRGNKLKDLREVIMGMCNDKLIHFFNRLREGCSINYGKVLLSKIVNSLRSICSRSVFGLDLIKALNEWGGVGVFNDNDLKLREYRIVATLTGFLIIADNLVSSRCEYRCVDDGSSPLYVDWWVGELSYKLNEVRGGGGWLEGCRWFA